MAESEQPQTYLITPPELELSTFPALLGAMLDATEVACVRLALSTRDEERICKVADALREVTHARDVALVISEHGMLVERMGLDGVHLIDGARSVRHWRKELGADAIVGAYCAGSRHDGMNAGEAGADYVSFGPVTPSALGDGKIAETDLFTWWSEVIEVPVVAEGGLDEDSIKTLCSLTDFFGYGAEIWNTDDPVKTLTSLVSLSR